MSQRNVEYREERQERTPMGALMKKGYQSSNLFIGGWGNIHENLVKRNAL